MQIELGGVYKDGNGDKIGPMTRSETGGDTPWYCRNNGLYRDDGSFIHNDPHGNDIVSEWGDDSVVEYTMKIDSEQAEYLQSAIDGDADALWMAFTWCDAPQGQDYWCDQANKHTPLDIEALKEIQRQCVTEQVGTLAELGVKAGDVVEYASGNAKFIGSVLTIQSDGTAKGEEYGKFFPKLDIVLSRTYRIISRADDEPKSQRCAECDCSLGGTYCTWIAAPPTAPKTWSEMTDAEKGAMLLVEFNGGDLQALAVDQDGTSWVPKHSKFAFHNTVSYRIKPEPKRETHAIRIVSDVTGDTYYGTIDLVDGEPDCGSVKMEVV